MRPQAKLFHFLDYHVDTEAFSVRFEYRMDFADRDSLDFVETISFPVEVNLSVMDGDVLGKFLEPLALILGISYYKLYCPPHIATAFPLSREQAEFWNTVYRKGLGEFFYRNHLDPNDVATFPYSEVTPSAARVQVSDEVLVGIGGGKDSIVAVGLLEGHDVTTFLMETEREDVIARRVSAAIGRPEVRVRRTLDPKIFETHEGSYNGHIPISVIIAFLELLIAALCGKRYAIVGNAHSSDFGNIVYRGEHINHQWSKTIEFESLMQKYTRKFITPDIVYFSLLRQFYEIRIAKIFAERQVKFFSIFASCNKNFRASKDRPTSLWCGECPKCAFVFLLFSAFLEKEDLVGIFGRNLFAEELLLPLFRDLLGFGEMKPFDCVGTFDESRGALVLASKRYGDDCVVRTLLPFVKNPEAILEETFRTSVASTLPSPFRLLGVERIGILGYGKEGVVTEKFLEEKYPQIERMILDQRMDESYLEKQVECDVVIKTPGIPKSKVIVPFVTATNLFFALNKNFTIGVTGSKGKSTTVSLIFEILKTAGKKVRLIGNIGNPMLGVLLEKVDPDEIFVIELSSYMLDDIEYSPNIAVLLNLFPEHMDYHGGIENYYAAKRKIFAFQKEGDIALQPPFSHEEIPLNDNEIPLIGEHNRCNIQIAIKVARLLNVSDEAIRIALRNFKSLPHRLEFVGTFEGIDFYDDAISTTPESTILAIQSLERVDTIFLGGEDRGYDFQELEKVLRQYQVKNIVLFPESGFRILQARENMNVFEAKTMESAVDFAFRCTKKGRICLLSTASPSYSLWKNFEEKGALFQSCVQTHS